MVSRYNYFFRSETDGEEKGSERENPREGIGNGLTIKNWLNDIEKKKQYQTFCYKLCDSCP